MFVFLCRISASSLPETVKVGEDYTVISKEKLERFGSLMKLGVNLYEELRGKKALGSSTAKRPADDFTYEEEQANMSPLKRYYLDNNKLDTKCPQCPESRPAFPSWSALDDHYKLTKNRR